MKGLVVTCKHIDWLDLREFTREISIILLRCIGNNFDRLLQFKSIQKKMSINPIYDYKTKAKENVPICLRLYSKYIVIFFLISFYLH